MNHLTTVSRRVLLALIGCVALGLGACVPSDKSVVTEDKQVFLDELVGQWSMGSGNDATLLTLIRGEGKTYDVTTFDAASKETGHALFRVMKLGEEYFYELEMKDKADSKPRYAFGRLTFDKSHITGWTFADANKMLSDPAITTAEIPDANDNTGKQRVVSMPADKVQAYLAAHAGEMKTESLKVDRVEAKK